MEKESNLLSQEALLFFYRQHVLTEFLTTLSDRELIDAENIIVISDIEYEKIGILDAIIQEKEYRLDSRMYQKRASSNKAK